MRSARACRPKAGGLCRWRTPDAVAGGPDHHSRHPFVQERTRVAVTRPSTDGRGLPPPYFDVGDPLSFADIVSVSAGCAAASTRASERAWNRKTHVMPALTPAGAHSTLIGYSPACARCKGWPASDPMTQPASDTLKKTP